MHPQHSDTESRMSRSPDITVTLERNSASIKDRILGNLDDLYRAINAGKPLQEYPFSYDIVPPKQEITHDLWSVNVQIPVRYIGTIEAQYGWQSNARKEYDGHLRSRGLPNFDLTLTTYSGDLKLKHEPIGTCSARSGERNASGECRTRVEFSHPELPLLLRRDLSIGIVFSGSFSP
jgi:hypothetical protein